LFSKGESFKKWREAHFCFLGEKRFFSNTFFKMAQSAFFHLKKWRLCLFQAKRFRRLCLKKTGKAL
jgi:hypothetical protein